MLVSESRAVERFFASRRLLKEVSCGVRDSESEVQG